MNIKFDALPIDSPFSFCDQIFTKVARHLAEDAEGLQHVFDDETEVEMISGPSAAEADCQNEILEKT